MIEPPRCPSCTYFQEPYSFRSYIWVFDPCPANFLFAVEVSVQLSSSSHADVQISQLCFWKRLSSALGGLGPFCSESWEHLFEGGQWFVLKTNRKGTEVSAEWPRLLVSLRRACPGPASPAKVPILKSHPPPAPSPCGALGPQGTSAFPWGRQAPSQSV